MKYDCETESIRVAPVQHFMKEKEEKLYFWKKFVYIYTKGKNNVDLVEVQLL